MYAELLSQDFPAIARLADGCRLPINLKRKNQSQCFEAKQAG